MNDRDTLNERWLRSLDDIQLEGLRYSLLRSDDERYERAAEHLLVRGMAHIDRVCAELCELRGLDSGAHTKATVSASLRLQLRLAREETLPAIEVLAGRMARESVNVLAPSEPALPRLATRPPRLRTIEGALSDALRSGRLRRRGGTS